MPTDLTEAKIINYLHVKYAGNSVYRVPNAYIFKHNWESDFFIQKQNGYGIEFEIKTSKRDFLKDKEKVDKHLILSSGKYINKSTKYNKVPNEPGQLPLFKFEATTETKEEVHNFRPNKFFYVVPEGMVKATDVPEYAGLMYVGPGGMITTIKEAPFIHKEKLKFEDKLCSKFYHYWLNQKHINNVMANEQEYHLSEIKRLKEEIFNLKQNAQ